MRKTKAQRAGVIKERVSIGPSFSLIGPTRGDWSQAMSPTDREACVAHFTEAYRLWASTWVSPELEELLPK